MAMIRIRGALRERNAIESVALQLDQTDTAWYTMYRSRHIPSFLTTVSLTPDAFDDLLHVFATEYTVLSGPGRRGRPPRIPHKHAVLAMVLHYYTAAVEHKTLQELFGVPPSTFARVLAKAEEALERSLSRIPQASVQWPSIPVQQEWSRLTNEREPLVEGVFAFVDGKNYRVQAPSSADLQNAHYNGGHNCPGSWNDGEVSRQLQARLADERFVGPGMKWVLRWKDYHATEGGRPGPATGGMSFGTPNDE
ncbi:hypothetical protein H257_14504 [Aphanomyces astaci]|uniref:DDE Tnp4 domain-containing protein n=1 Tax=Aphanomyces astaci TaxID=112090 RepID=W4FQY0_APHAT|nr:hypothetical protein H257_14504 [Aphanomyces astaci]ETV69905.1 hypothetical protein H257_14504 [Aphanomyces astaci]|eukprot:XP_009840643.1 hypothetical protein H257_14504 [Aphanomyces astaci]